MTIKIKELHNLHIQNPRGSTLEQELKHLEKSNKLSMRESHLHHNYSKVFNTQSKGQKNLD